MLNGEEGDEETGELAAEAEAVFVLDVASDGTEMQSDAE